MFGGGVLPIRVIGDIRAIRVPPSSGAALQVISEAVRADVGFRGSLDANDVHSALLRGSSGCCDRARNEIARCGIISLPSRLVRLSAWIDRAVCHHRTAY
jgi:hypothetical protein